MRKALPGIARFARHFAPYLRAHRGLIAGAMGALLVQALFRLLEPWPLKFIIDRIVGAEGKSGRFDSELLSSLDTNLFLTVVVLALVIITGFRAMAGYYSIVGFALIGNRVLTRLREQLFRHLQSISLGFHDRARGGDLVIRMIGDIGMVKEVAVTAVLPLLGNIVILAGMLAVMFWLHWQLALVALAITPLLWLLTMKRSKAIQRVARRNRQREGDMAATAAESMGAIKTVQALTLGDTFADTFARANNQSLKEGVQAKRLAAGLERMVDVLIAIATALVLWFGARLVLTNELTPGELLVFVFYLRRAFRPMRDFAKYTARLAKASAAGERVLELLEQEPGVQELPDAVIAPDFKGNVAFHQVTHGYEDGRAVLHDIDLVITSGERVAITGPSGSGKSTLASLLLRLYDPQQGKVTIDGADIRDFTLESLRARIAIVLQDSLLFATTVRNNITAGIADIPDEQIEAAARLANAHDFITSLPEGYDTQLGERGVTLSNGQRQRIAIARAAIRQSPILILDEPTTGLDRANAREITVALERLAAGRTTLLITHRPEMAARADRVVFIRHGRIVAQGTHQSLLADNTAYARLFGQTAGGEMQHFDGDAHAVFS
jgi:ATP-binding cassette subfamily B protein